MSIVGPVVQSCRRIGSSSWGGRW